MSDKPIIFSTPMVKALLNGRKTMTRRITKKQDWPEAIVKRWPNQHHTGWEVGDRLWVRENLIRIPTGWVYAADGPAADKIRIVPSIHMPRYMSRLTLAATAVKVERLKDIGPDDIMAEGCPVPFEDYGDGSPQSWFGAGQWWEDLWKQINGLGAWDANPFVAAITFIVEKRNIDA